MQAAYAFGVCLLSPSLSPSLFPRDTFLSLSHLLSLSLVPLVGELLQGERVSSGLRGVSHCFVVTFAQSRDPLSLSSTLSLRLFPPRSLIRSLARTLTGSLARSLALSLSLSLSLFPARCHSPSPSLSFFLCLLLGKREER